MGKYDALGAFLRRWSIRYDAEGVELSFAQIEGVINALLPNAAAEPGWWHVKSATDRNAPHRRAWLEAGFDVTAEPHAERVYFRKQTQA